jgi:hypothetical protein
MLSGHTVLNQIDKTKPYFTREITRQLEGKSTKQSRFANNCVFGSSFRSMWVKCSPNIN